ncbi:MAG: acylphosphatase, partial [Vulcanimicrobiota bacterium]
VFLKIEGVVQGVGFRYFTRQNAQAIGLTGWVRNAPDGSVETVLEGEEHEVQEMIKRLKQGPASSRVDNVDIQWEDYQGEFSTFSVRF